MITTSTTTGNIVLIEQAVIAIVGFFVLCLLMILLAHITHWWDKNTKDGIIKPIKKKINDYKTKKSIETVAKNTLPSILLYEYVKQDVVKALDHHQELLELRSYSAEVNQCLLDWQHCADAGDPNAQYYLGSAYLYGFGVTLNKEYAFHYLLKAARQDHAKASELIIREYGNHFL
jgi:hypothetical protein